MIKTIEYKDIIKDPEDYILIDVRTPKEFKEATIPGACNIPVLTDEDREKIGYVYVNESVEKAKRMGVEATSKRLLEIYDNISKIYKKHSKLVFFCAKGGMRSGSVSSLINSLGFSSYKLKGGYKGYREYINRELPAINENLKYIVLHGKTGIGKTEILKKLKEKGYDTLDLEFAANHRGSLLGSVGLGESRSQKAFESIIYEQFRARKSNYIFVEGESKRIGNIIIPGFIYDSMKKGVHLYLDSTIEFRVDNLLSEYTTPENADKEILDALDKMARYISDKNICSYKELIKEKKYEEVSKELMIKYYDPMYSNSMKKHEYVGNIFINSIEEATNAIIKWFDNNIASLEDYYGLGK